MLEAVLLESYYILRKPLKNTIFNIFEQALGEMVLSGRVPTVSGTQMCNFVQFKELADVIVQKALSNIAFLVLIVETANKLVSGAVNK